MHLQMMNINPDRILHILICYSYKLHFLEPLICRPIMRLFQHHVTIRTQYASRALYSIFSPSCSPKQGWKYVLNAFCRFKTLNLSFIPSVLSNIFKKQYTEKKWFSFRGTVKFILFIWEGSSGSVPV